MKPIRTRDELITFALAHCPSAACARALQEGNVVNWGVFHLSLTDILKRDGWVLEVTSVHNNKWILAIWPNVESRMYAWVQLTSIPWPDYGGPWKTSLWAGDDPHTSFIRRNNAYAAQKT